VNTLKQKLSLLIIVAITLLGLCTNAFFMSQNAMSHGHSLSGMHECCFLAASTHEMPSAITTAMSFYFPLILFVFYYCTYQENRKLGYAHHSPFHPPNKFSKGVVQRE